MSRLSGEPVRSLENAVDEALAGIRAKLRAHAGDVEVVSISPEGDVSLAFTGTCISCPAQALTFGSAVLPVVESVAGIGAIRVEGMNVSPAAMRRIRAMAG
ncbi:NifU family protein [Bosea psychrotolerans]|uniref:NifU-like protein n=1 Tax=Bosea psychrotolerans TaxID=1871628 RepID=A0A2S4MB41_9HYPH|nr:NifU family protein [Bosea psychrotolerans]POR51953.1 NifU-like protein [Bosea psychrotolerans]